MIRVSLFLAIVCVGASFADADVLLVPSEYTRIQHALDAASSGDTVLVAPGIYSGCGNRDLDFHGKNLMLIGKAGASATLIDCEELGRGFRLTGGEGPDCLIRGFTVLGGRALGAGAGGKGGGLYLSDASPRIEACVFAEGEAQFGGGLAAEWNSAPSLSGCVFRDNHARLEGGGAYLLGGGGLWADCTLSGNRAGTNGDDLFLSDAAPRLERCRLQSDRISETSLLP